MDYTLARAKKRFVATRRAERRLWNRLNDIDWEYETLLPAVKELEKKAGQGVLDEVSMEEPGA